MKDNIPEAGKIYNVRHSRKGNFTILVTGLCGEWITGTIVKGYASAMMKYNECGVGDSITIRKSHSDMVEVTV